MKGDVKGDRKDTGPRRWGYVCLHIGKEGSGRRMPERKMAI